jgi:CO/xanthine dehydrogenase FAD-binding subunit
MKPPPFDYHRADTVEHACRLLADAGEDARLLAGGQSLIPMMNLRLARPSALVDIGRLPLSNIDVEPGRVTIGALARHRQVLEHEALRAAAPLFAETYEFIAHPTVRNVGTAGGSVAHADPTAEIPALLVLLDGEIEAVSARGARKIAAGDFFKSAFTTALKPDEMITSLSFHMPPRRWGGCFLELAERHGDFALAAAGVVLARDGDKIAEARIVLTGAESVPVRAAEVEASLRGRTLTEAQCAEAGAAAARDRRSYDDIRASAEYRRSLLSELTSRALLTAYRRAGTQP